MSKLNRGFNQTALNGSIGAVTYVTRKGITVARQKVPAKSSARRTLRSQTQRMKWMNNIRIWQSLNTVGWHPSFMNKSGLQSDFNMFIKANAALSGVYLTKQEVDANGGVVAGVQLTQGTLPPIGGTLGDGGKFVTTIRMGGITIGASTTVKTFSTAIVDNNPFINNGDQLTFVALHQLEDSNEIPRIQADVREITLDVNDELTLLSDILPANMLTVEEGVLVTSGSTNGGAAVVHSSLTNNVYTVSSERLEVNNNLLRLYQSDEALQKSILSYGGLSAVQFLVPNVEDLVSAPIEP